MLSYLAVTDGWRRDIFQPAPRLRWSLRLHPHIFSVTKAPLHVELIILINIVFAYDYVVRRGAGVPRSSSHPFFLSLCAEKAQHAEVPEFRVRVLTIYRLCVLDEVRRGAVVVCFFKFNQYRRFTNSYYANRYDG